MLFGYPLAAVQDNWLHECVCDAVRTIHAAADANQGYPGFPDVLPEPHQGALKRRLGLRDRLKAYNDAIRRLTRAERDQVLEALESENRIPELLSGALGACTTLDDLPPAVHEPIADLFGFTFELLGELGLRDKQYKAIYESIPHHLCPFCGAEHFDAPGAKREALDHYLMKSRYPFAGANLRHLVPIGHKCNSGYKGSKDILRWADGSRRVAFDPYNHSRVHVSLDDSEPFGGTTEPTPKWVIRFDPDSPETQTWDDVFEVRERYIRDHLDPSYVGWLRTFAQLVRRGAQYLRPDQGLVDLLRGYEETFLVSGLEDRAFLKAAVFRMLRLHCEAGHQRLLKLLGDLLGLPATSVARELASSVVHEAQPGAAAEQKPPNAEVEERPRAVLVEA